MTTVTAKTSGLLEMVNISVVGERANLTEAQLRGAYDWTVALWDRLGIPPESLGVSGPGFAPSRKKRSFRRMQAKIDEANFGQLKFIQFNRSWPASDIPNQDLAIFALRRPLERSTTWDPIMCLLPPAIGVSEAELERYLLEFAAITAGRYGYIFYQKAGILGPFFYAGGVIGGGDFEADPETHQEQVANICQWRPDIAEREQVLRDLYPINLLTQHYLDLPFGDSGMTLQDWIQRDASRGTLEPLAGAEHITIWRPVIENIPKMRTDLFKGGLLFYWRHIMSDQPEYRDFSKPFTPPQTIPAIFRPEFYAGRDPKVTR